MKDFDNEDPTTPIILTSFEIHGNFKTKTNILVRWLSPHNDSPLVKKKEELGNKAPPNPDEVYAARRISP